MDQYEKLRLLLDAHPSGAPKSEKFDEILRILFSPEEAAVAAAMGFSPRSVDAIAAACGIPAETAEGLLERMADRAVVFCRISVGACDAPREVCLIFEATGRFLVERGYAREISREEAKKVLDSAEAAGLVHTSSNSQDRATFICNCCPCCCTILRGLTQLKLPHAFATSGFQAEANPDSCNGCGICADERCPVGAIVMKDDRAVVTTAACIGCGLCVTACPTEALSLVRRDPPPEIPATAQEMGMKVLTEKGKLEAFMLASKR